MTDTQQNITEGDNRRRTLRVLLVEDSAYDADLVTRQLRKSGYGVDARRVETVDAFAEALAAVEWDVIVADYAVPGFGAVPALNLLNQSGRDIPFIIVSGGISDQTAVAAMRAGAHDYVLKDNIARLVPAIEREMQEAVSRREKRHAQEALRDSQASFEGIVRSAMDAIISVDEEQRIVLFNDAAERVFRCTRAEALGRPLDHFIPEQFRNIHRDHVRRFGQSGSTTRSMYSPGLLTGLRCDGEEFPIEATISQIKTGERKLFTVILRDITERRRAEQALLDAKVLAETSLAQLRATLDSMTEGLYIVDAHGRPIVMNEVMKKMFGVDHASPLHEHQSSFELSDLNGDPLRREERPASRVLRGETICRYEALVRTVDKKKEWIISYSGAPVRDSIGTVVMAVLTVEDITTAKASQQALIRSEKLAATGRLAATIAHEINNPLESLMNVVYLLRQKVADASALQYVDMIDKQVQTLARIATQTLKFHRENGQPVEYRLSELVTELLEFYEPKAMQHGVKVSKRIETAGRLFGFIGEIRQVVSNLLINAVEATPNGGKIMVRLHESTDWRTGHRGYRLSIADTGYGIDREHRARIFEPFFTTKGESGTGLGLWVSMGIINRANGSMHVWSSQRPGRAGTCFSIFLPSGVPVIQTPARRRYEAAQPASGTIDVARNAG